MRRFVSSPRSLLLSFVVVAGIANAAPPPSSSPPPPPSSSSSSSSSIAASLETARAAIGRSDWAGVVAALEAAAQLARPKAPLVVSAAEVVNGAHVGVGVYDKALEGVVSDRRLRLYVEVENPTASPLGPGRYRQEFDVVGRFFVVDGTTLQPLGEKNLGRQTVDTWRPLAVHALGLDVTLGDAPAGPYVVEVVVTDVASKRSATRRVSFTLREQPGKR